MLGHLLALPFWVAAVVGLVLTKKVGSEETAPPPVWPATRLALSATTSTATVACTRDGEGRLRLAVGLPESSAALAAFEDWVARGATATLRIEVEDPEDARGKTTIEVPGAEFALLGNHLGATADDGRIILAERGVTCRAGRDYEIRAALSGRDDFLEDLDPVLLVGEEAERVLIVHRDARPGALLALGLMGVIAHLTLILGLIVVPFRPALPPDPILA
ncbi:MAG: hypothetical protein R3F20_04930 [Planctomycetota bacterium]